MLAGTVTTGGVVSRTLTLNEPLVLFPALSVAVQVTTVVPRPNVVPEAGVQTGVIEPSTMSVAVAVNVTLAPAELIASAVIVAGTTNTGSVVSRIYTLKWLVAVLPRVSLDEQMTWVVPMPNVLPDSGRQLTDRTPSTRSDAVGSVYVTIAPPGPVASAD